MIKLSKGNKKGLALSERSESKGFTLIELLIVITIIGILMALAIASYAKTRAGARDAKRQSDLEQIRSALEIYRADCGRYPLGTQNQGGGYLQTMFPTGNLVGSQPQCTGNIYLEKFPTDPKNGWSYVYVSGSTFFLCARLEMSSSQLTDSRYTACTSDIFFPCGGTGNPCNYAANSP